MGLVNLRSYFLCEIFGWFLFFRRFNSRGYYFPSKVFMWQELARANSPIFARIGIFNFFWFCSGKQDVFLLCFLLEIGLLTDHSIASSKNPTDGKENVTLITSGKSRLVGSLNWNLFLRLLARIHGCVRQSGHCCAAPAAAACPALEIPQARACPHAEGGRWRADSWGEGQTPSQMSACGWRVLAAAWVRTSMVHALAGRDLCFSLVMNFCSNFIFLNGTTLSPEFIK